MMMLSCHFDLPLCPLRVFSVLGGGLRVWVFSTPFCLFQIKKENLPWDMESFSLHSPNKAFFFS